MKNACFRFPMTLLATFAFCAGSPALAQADDAAPAVDLEKGLIFHVSFDGSLEADTAAGEKKPSKDKDVKLVEGRFGQGAEVKQAAQLYYPGGKNFSLKQGTVALWFKRDKAWAANAFILFKAVGGPDWNRNALYLMTTDHKQLRAWVWDANAEQKLIMSPNNIEYQAGQWYHLAATFTDGAVKIYIDGKEISYGTPADPMMEMPSAEVKNIQFGSDYTPDSVADGVLDELRIYDRPLSADEVAKLAAPEPTPAE